tara:strand:+ start:688 stop:1362 length:675 start_codon:yes stop_codon:yes gene_type:complete
MLRPKKHITKKEIQRDPLLESVDQAQAHIEKNRSMYTMVGVALVAILIGINIINDKREKNSVEASSTLGQALISLDRGDVNTAKFQLETVINDYENTNSGNLSNYYLGKMKYELEEYDKAENHINIFLKNNSHDYLVASAYEILSDIKLRNNDIDEAIRLIDDGLSLVDNQSSKISLQLRKAKLVLKNGDKELSRTIVDNILEEKNLGSDYKKIAEEIFGKLTG